MKKLIAAVLASSVVAFSASSTTVESLPAEKTSWTTGVALADGTENGVTKKYPVAVFAYSHGIMTIGNESAPVVMQLVCTIKKDKAIRIMTDLLPKVNTIDTSIFVDGRVFRQSYNWDRNESVIYRHLDKSLDLLDTMERGRKIGVRFEHNGKQYNSEFLLTGFTAMHKEFDRACGF